MNREEGLRALATYFDLMAMNGGARVYRSAREMGILDAVASGAASVDAVARKCGLKTGPMAVMLDTLCAMGVLRREEGEFAPAPVLQLLSGNYRDLSDAYWDHLPTLLGTGEPIARMDDASQSEAQYEKQVTALAWMMKPSAMAAARALGIGTERRGLAILDAGAGSAVWSLTFASADAESRVTAVDWPAVLKIASASAEQQGLAERFTALAGNFHEVALPEGAFDLAIVAMVTHIETPEGNRDLFGRIHKALRPTGEIAVFDVLPGDERGRLSGALYALGLALRTTRGHVYTRDELASLLAETGYAEPTFTPLEAPPWTMGMMLARKGGGSC